MIYHTAATQLGLLQRGGGGTRAGFNKDDGMEESISGAGPRKVLPLPIHSGPPLIKLSGRKEKTASKESEGDSGREGRLDAVVGLLMRRAEPRLPHPLVKFPPTVTACVSLPYEWWANPSMSKKNYDLKHIQFHQDDNN